jgi:hypothetical protein
MFWYKIYLIGYKVSINLHGNTYGQSIYNKIGAVKTIYLL